VYLVVSGNILQTSLIVTIAVLSLAGALRIQKLLEVEAATLSLNGDLLKVKLQEDENEIFGSWAKVGNKRMVMRMINDGFDIAGFASWETKGNTILHLAAMSWDVEACSFFLDIGIAIEAKNKEGRTPLHVSAINRNVEVVKALLERGADIEAKDEKGKTALHLAAFQGTVEEVKVLLEHGADIEAKRKYGNTPLDRAKDRDNFQNGKEEIISILENALADTSRNIGSMPTTSKP